MRKVVFNLIAVAMVVVGLAVVTPAIGGVSAMDGSMSERDAAESDSLAELSEMSGDFLMRFGGAGILAADGWDEVCDHEIDSQVRGAAGCNDVNADTGTVNGIVGGILNVVIGMVGVIAVVVIVIAGIQMSTSNGVPEKVAKARRALLYAVIGLVVAIASFAIVNFVLDRAL